MTVPPRLLNSTARNVARAFDGCLLLPVRPGDDPDQVPLPLVSEAQAPGYRARLGTHSIAVVLGYRSGGLFAVNFDSDLEYEAFLERNEHCRNSLITRHAGHPVVWLRTLVAHRVSLSLPGLAVRMVGNELVLDRRSLDGQGSIVNAATPCLVDVEAMDWSPAFPGQVDVWLTNLFQGELLRRSKRGHLVARPTAWRYLLARQLRGAVAYEPRKHQFYQATGGGKWQPLEDDQLLDLVRQRIAQIPVKGEKLKSLLTEEFLKRLIRRLRPLLAATLSVAEEELRAFADQHLMLEPGADTTTRELYQAYAANCRQRGLSPLALTIFQRALPPVLAEEPWLRPRSNSIPRPSGHQRGFRGLRLKESERARVTESGTPGTPGTDFASRKYSATTSVNDRSSQTVEACIHGN